MSDTMKITRSRRANFTTGLILVLGGIGTAFGTLLAERSAASTDRERFVRRAEYLRAEFEEYSAWYLSSLDTIRALWAANQHVNRSEFAAYIANINLAKHYPGALGIGFIRPVRRSRLDEFLAETRADGTPDFKLKTDRDAEEFQIVEFMEPARANHRTIGFDMGSELERRHAIERSLETGEPSLTRPIQVNAGDHAEIGFLSFLPLWRKGMPRNTSTERRAALEGWVFMPITARGMLQELNDRAMGELDFEVFEGSTPNRESLIFDDDGHLLDQAGAIDSSRFAGRYFVQFVPVEINGQQWTIAVSTTDRFPLVSRSAKWGICLGCLSLTCLAAGIVWSMGKTADRAWALANVMTSDLRESESRYREMSDAVPVMVWTTDADGKFTSVNRSCAEFTGRAAAEELGEDWLSVVHPAERNSIGQAYRDIVIARQPFEMEFRARRFDGDYRWVFNRGVPRFSEDGVFLGYIGGCIDISERKEAERSLQRTNEELARTTKQLEALAAEFGAKNVQLEAERRKADAANEAKSEFLANMSHEIRTPMTAILGYAELLFQEGDISRAPEGRVKAIKTVQRNGEHLLGLINDILDLSKIEAGKLSVETIPCSPVAIVTDVVELMKVRSQAKSIGLCVEYEGLIPETIQSDPTRIRQVLVNLVGNAIKFTTAGEVRIVVRLLDGSVPKLEFDVVDSGIGMTAEQMDRLFKPFSQADTSMSRQFGGTGLGLTISRRLAEYLGGDVAIVESRPGVGTRFRLSIETGSIDGVRLAAIGHQEPKRTSTTSRLSPIDGSLSIEGCQILVAEDGSDNQKLIGHLLKKAGATATIVENGQLAVDAALAAENLGQPFDVVIMDMQMPVLDGYKATTLLREKGYRRPILALTAHAMDGDRERCLAAGCDDFATKPIDRNRLFDQIAQWKNATPAVSVPA